MSNVSDANEIFIHFVRCVYFAPVSIEFTVCIERYFIETNVMIVWGIFYEIYNTFLKISVENHLWIIYYFYKNVIFFVNVYIKIPVGI